MLASAGMEGNDRGDGFGLEKLVDPMGIEATVVHASAHRDRYIVSRAGLQETVQTARAHREVGHMARGDHNMYWKGMLRSDDTVLEIAVTKEESVPIGVIAPGSGRIAVEPVMITAKDAVGATVAGGPPVGTGPRGQRCPVAAQDERLEVAQEPTVG
jgi:hypothetical protein